MERALRVRLEQRRRTTLKACIRGWSAATALHNIKKSFDLMSLQIQLLCAALVARDGDPAAVLAACALVDDAEAAGEEATEDAGEALAATAGGGGGGGAAAAAGGDVWMSPPHASLAATHGADSPFSPLSSSSSSFSYSSSISPTSAAASSSPFLSAVSVGDGGAT